MQQIIGKLDLFGCGEFNGSFNCVCGKDVAFLGSSAARADDIMGKIGFSIWSNGEFVRDAADIKCLKCGAVYDLQPIFTVTMRNADNAQKETDET